MSAAERLSAGVLALFLIAGAAAKTQAGETRRVSFDVTFQDDVQRDVLEAWRDRIHAASDMLYQATEGRMAVGRCYLKDKSSLGEIVIPLGRAEEVELRRGGSATTDNNGTSHWHIRSSGRPDGHGDNPLGRVILREFGRAFWGLPDERDASVTCSSCVMGDNPDALTFCGPDDHRGEWSCRERIAKHMEWPSDWTPGTKPPEPESIIMDRLPDEPSRDNVELTNDAMRKALKDLERRKRAIELEVSFEGDVDEIQFADWKLKVVVMNGLLRHVTGEQFAITKVVMKDKTKKGDIVIQEGTEDSMRLDDMSAMWTLKKGSWRTAGLVPAGAFGRFVLPEWLDIEEGDPDCKNCLINLEYFSSSIPAQLCTEATHSGKKRSCAEQLEKRWKKKGVVRPDDADRDVILPPPRFEVVNR